MSNDLLTPAESAEAAAQGWGIHHVFDLATSSWSIRILPTDKVTLVVNLARSANATALKALRLLVVKPKGKK